MAGIVSKPFDYDLMKYVEQFDFVTLAETFVNNSFDLSVLFCDHVIFVSPADKLYQGRQLGGVIVWLKKMFQ